MGVQQSGFAALPGTASGDGAGGAGGPTETGGWVLEDGAGVSSRGAASSLPVAPAETLDKPSDDPDDDAPLKPAALEPGECATEETGC